MKRLLLHNFHEKLGAKFIEFAGYEMPVTYNGVKIEHHSVRNNIGLFDVSHMGEFFVSGSNSVDFLNFSTSNDVTSLKIGEAQYSYIPNYKGGVVDDIIVYRIEKEKFMLVVNASNIEKDFLWLNKLNKKFNSKIKNDSDKYSLLSIQGPNSIKFLNDIGEIDFSKMKRFKIVNTKIANQENIMVSSTGYTGEIGFEIYIPSDKIYNVWDIISNNAKKYNLSYVGLAARDTLRLEMGYCLYGKELTEKISPISAGLGWCTNFNKKFVGSEIIYNEKINGTQNKRIGFVMNEKGIPRENYLIYSLKSELIGRVSSGTLSPTLNKGVGMGYINKEFSKYRNTILFEIRGKLLEAEIYNPPFVR